MLWYCYLRVFSEKYVICCMDGYYSRYLLDTFIRNKVFLAFIHTFIFMFGSQVDTLPDMLNGQ